MQTEAHIDFCVVCDSNYISVNLQAQSKAMRTRKPTKGRVTGVKFDVKGEDKNDLKKAKAQLLKELEESEKNKKDWYDKELDKNLKK